MPNYHPIADQSPHVHRCDDGWVGTFCDDPCPGGPNHPTLAGAFPCLGRGTCALGSSGTAVCNCVTGYIGTACDQAIGVCGDGLVNVGEECDDGASLFIEFLFIFARAIGLTACFV